MIEQLASGLADVWTGPAMFAALLGGIATGWVVENVAPTRKWRTLMATVAGVGVLAVAVFWSGQITDALIGGDPNWGRAVARAFLQAGFVIAAAITAGLLRRRQALT